jgi:oligo-1,6-glucosidase
VFLYTRTLEEVRLIVVASFRPSEVRLAMPMELVAVGKCLIWNYEAVDKVETEMVLRPYEAIALLTDA